MAAMTPDNPTGSGNDSNSSAGGGLLTVTDKGADSGEYVILDTLTDQFDRAKAKANAEDHALQARGHRRDGGPLRIQSATHP